MDEFLKLNNIGAKYHKASFENEWDMDKKIKEGGEKWCENPKKSLIITGDVGNGKT